MSNKLTSMEWFANELIKNKIIKKDIYSTYHDFPTTFELIFEEAKEMHKQEIIDAWNDGSYGSGEFMINHLDADSYYNHTF